MATKKRRGAKTVQKILQEDDLLGYLIELAIEYLPGQRVSQDEQYQDESREFLAKEMSERLGFLEDP